MKKVLLGLLVIISVVLLTGCGKTTKKTETKDNTPPIIGSWAHGNYVYTFNSDKTGDYSYGETKMEFTYEDNGDELEILYTGNTVAGKFAYKIKGKKLIIKDSFGNDVEYIKK